MNFSEMPVEIWAGILEEEGEDTTELRKWIAGGLQVSESIFYNSDYDYDSDYDSYSDGYDYGYGYGYDYGYGYGYDDYGDGNGYVCGHGHSAE